LDAPSLETLLAVALVASLAPAVVDAIPAAWRIPQVVVLLLGGILIGPHGLGLADTPSIKLLADIGLGFLFLLAGYELDLRLLAARPGRLAMASWAVSAVIAICAVAGFTAIGYVRDFIPIALALTTTALGTLLPILTDSDMLAGRFGRYVLAAGAVGELFPIIAISLFLTRRAEFVAVGSLLAVAAAAALLTLVPWLVGRKRLRTVIKEGQRATAQATLRWSVVLLVGLLLLAERFGLDVVLGAVLAGMVLRTWMRREGIDARPLEEKLDAVGYGIFIPIFFVSSGMTLDVPTIIKDPLRLLVFLGLLLAVRGLPCLLIYRGTLPWSQRAQMTLITATTLPLLIALAAIGMQDGVMLPANAAAIVGAGVLSVLVYPTTAVALARRDRGAPSRAAPPARQAAAGGPGAAAGLPGYGACHRVAMPWPTPMHMAAAARAAPRRRISCSRVVVILAPEQPSGWPIAIAPPFTLTSSGSSLSSSMTAMACAANASLTSARPRLSLCHPALASSRVSAGTGPIPMKSGWTPADAVPAYLAIGSAPAAAAARSDISSRPAAPSLSGEEFPPVTVPSLRKAGLRAASSSRVRSARMPSSAATSAPLPGTVTGTISSASRPAAAARAARWWLCSANLSCRSRSTP
jgi:Kef-type K+ transport system membrane component KefB